MNNWSKNINQRPHRMGGFFKESSVITLHYITFYLTQATSVFYPGTFWGKFHPQTSKLPPKKFRSRLPWS